MRKQDNHSEDRRCRMIREFRHLFIEYGESYEVLVDQLVQFLISYESIVKHYIDKKTLSYLYTINSKAYVIGHSDSFYHLQITDYKRERLSIKDVTHGVVDLLLDLITYMTDELCAVCGQCYLRLLIDEDGKLLFRACENCFSKKLNHQWITTTIELYPASKKQIHKFLSQQP